MPKPTDPPSAFIIGCPRSGTTLLRAMLDSHPRVAVPPESYFTVKALRRAARYGGPEAFDRTALLADIRDKRDLSDDTRAKLKDALTAFGKVFA